MLANGNGHRNICPDVAVGDKSKRSLRKKRLIPTQLDLEGIPLPDLDPNQEDDATPRASLANLEGSMQNLNIDPQGTDATASEWSSSEPHTLAESSPNYLYNPPNQGMYRDPISEPYNDNVS